jgi:hypothetical protein
MRTGKGQLLAINQIVLASGIASCGGRLQNRMIFQLVLGGVVQRIQRLKHQHLEHQNCVI